jgi:hypothetical protein
LVTPGFLADGVDFRPLVYHYLASDYKVIIDDPQEMNIYHKLTQHVIDDSFKYGNDTPDQKNQNIKKKHIRFQMIFNSTLQELYLERAGLGKRSSSVWLITGEAEGGTDFVSSNNKRIEAKIYKDSTSMFKYAKKAATDPTVFHDADYVCVYLMDYYERAIGAVKEKAHWVWLTRIAGEYVEYFDVELKQIAESCLPAVLPVCHCLETTSNKLIIGQNTYCLV